MRLPIYVIAMAALVGAADEKTQTKPVPAASGKTATRAKTNPPPPALTIPSGAIETAAGTWTWTDAQGKNWIYRKTPFGLTRFEAPSTQAEEQVKRKDLDQARAYENGDTIRFERPGPFGLYRWERKRGELSDTEKLILERERSRHTSSEKAATE